MAELSEFSPANVGEIVDRIVSEMKDVSSKWWTQNSGLMSGYVRTLAEATLQTRAALAEKRISPAQADMILHNQELAFNQTLKFSKYMTFALAQKLLDTVFKVVGWVIYNVTGVNLAPNLVQPKAAAG